MLAPSRRGRLWRGVMPVVLSLVGVLAVALDARGVILYSTPTRNTDPPSVADGLAAWELEAQWGSYLATPIDSTHFIASKHISVSSEAYETITFMSTSYNVNTLSRTVDPDSDICIYSLQNGYAFPTYAALYDAVMDGSEIDKTLTVIGRGTQRGSEVLVDSSLRGWQWGAGDQVQSWGRNVVSGFEDYSSTSLDSLLYFNFDGGGSGITNESALSSGDSSGGVFIKIGVQWKLAGVSYAVSGPWSLTGTEPKKEDGFNASIFDAQSLYYWDSGWVYDPYHEPGRSYASRISDRLGWIESILVPEPGVLLLLGSGLPLVLVFLGRCARRRGR